MSECRDNIGTRCRATLSAGLQGKHSLAVPAHRYQIPFALNVFWLHDISRLIGISIADKVVPNKVSIRCNPRAHSAEASMRHRGMVEAARCIRLGSVIKFVCESDDVFIRSTSIDRQTGEPIMPWQRAMRSAGVSSSR